MTDRFRMGVAIAAVAGLGATAGFVKWGDAAEPSQPEIVAVEAALAAWAEFAGTGDMSTVDDVFVIGGPQHQQLRREAATIVPGSIYEFTLSEPELVAAGLVRGVVTVRRAGERELVFNWDLQLIEENGRWKLWTVHRSS
ncbi:MAG TPA: hypothetical protein VIA81_03195 [Acidimicrobiia bacterium]|jgi:hypothetical protein